MRRHIGIAGSVVLFVVVAFVTHATEVQLQKLPLGDPATSMTMTEDGKYLLVAHEEKDKLSVWDVTAGKVVRTIECPSPRFTLCRGGKVYVANYGKGTITILDVQKEWQAIDQLRLEDKKIFYLSAPGGKHFKDVLLATCEGPGSSDSALVVNLAKEEVRRIETASMAVFTVSFDGQTVVKQSGSSGATEAYDAAAYLAKASDKRLPGHPGASAGLLFQIGEGPFWLTGKQIYRGIPARPFANEVSGVLFPDLTRPVFYELNVDKSRITVHEMSPAMTELGSFQVAQYPKPMDHWWYYGIHFRPKKRMLHPIAATHDEKAHLFTYHNTESAVYRAELPLKEIIRGAVAKQGNSSPEAGPDKFPALIVEGRKMEHRLQAEEAKAVYTVMQGPAGIQVSGTGLLTWTPSASDAGPQQIKIKAKIGEKTEFYRISTEVVRRELAERVGEDLSRIKSIGTHYVLTDCCDLRIGGDNDEIVLLTGREMRILDSEGSTVIRQTRLPFECQNAAGRKDYFLCLRPGELAFVDRNTLRPTRQVKLPGNKVGDLALHPTERVAFVSVFDDEGGKLNPIAARKVLKVNEQTGDVTVFPNVLGTKLAVHPQGKYLYTSLEERYRDGYILNLYWGNVRPSYDTVSAIASYDIKGSGLSLRHLNIGPGGCSKFLRVSPDGANICFHGGEGDRQRQVREFGNRLGVFDADDIRPANLKTQYEIASFAVDASYHPVLDWVAVCCPEGVSVHKRGNGEKLVEKVNWGDAKLSAATQVLFAPGGRHLLVDSEDQSGRRAVRAFPLHLTDQEQATVNRCARPSR
jgi:DNA-binding beta-propeller fold protein YncE